MEPQLVGDKEPRKWTSGEVTTTKQKAFSETDRLGDIYMNDTKTPAQSNFTMWYPGISEIYPLQEIVTETSRFMKKTTNIIQRHSGTVF